MLKKLALLVRCIFSRDERLRLTVKEFAHANQELLIIVCDPKSDRIFATYKDKYVNGKIKSPSGRKTHVVRETLKLSRFYVSIDQYLTAIMETLGVPIWKSGPNQLFLFLDGAIFNIARSLSGRGKRDAKASAKAPGPGDVPSPFYQPAAPGRGEQTH